MTAPAPRRFADQVAVVTGASGKIGRAIAVRLAAEGAAVAVGGRDATRLARTVTDIQAAGGRAVAAAGDVTDAAAMAALVAAAERAFGPVDCLAAIAGGGGAEQPVDAVDPARWAQVLHTNVVGTFHAVRAALPGMRTRGRGTLLTCTGGGGWFPVPGHELTAYATAKAAICRFTDQLAVELFDTGVRVNCLQPGKVLDEDQARAMDAEERRTGRRHPNREGTHPPEDAAELAALLLSDESAPLSGRIASVDEDWWRDPERRREVAADDHLACLRRLHP